jgi:hypothetical protein
MPPYTNPTSPTSARPVPPESFPLAPVTDRGGDTDYVEPRPPTAAVPAPPEFFGSDLKSVHAPAHAKRSK